MYIAPEQGQTSPWSRKFDVNRKLLPLRGRDRQPFVDKILIQQKGLLTLSICCKFQKISLKSYFIHIFACFYTCI